MYTVLLDPASYDCLNLGDLAMLQVAIQRWRALWPSASIAVLTNAPDALLSIAPTAIPVSARGRSMWLNTHVFGRLHPRLPVQARARVERLERRLKLDIARPLESAFALRHGIAGGDAAEFASFLRWMRRADVLALTGGGGLTDAFSTKASAVLDTLQIAARRARHGGRPVTAIFGQGFGPIDRAGPLWAKAAAALPSLDFIALREGRTSRSLLHELGVPDDRIVETGDDAIELAYDEQSREIGAGLGVNVRVAYYSRTDASILGALKEILRTAATRYGAPLVPVPVSRQPGGTDRPNAEQADALAIRELLAGIAEPRSAEGMPDSPTAVIHAVARCRLVITGSYHGAVFALAQGIQAIAIAGSEYYRAKFLGLAQQFETGLEVVDLAQPAWDRRLETAMARAWQSAGTVRPVLLRSAERQIELSRRAYRTVAQLAEARHAVPAPPTQSKPQRPAAT
jgi:polysaccharide pyruvyl transferase WcaK-like protein